MELRKLCVREKYIKLLGNLIALILLTVACAAPIVLLWSTAARLAVCIVAGAVWLVLAVPLVIWPSLWYNRYLYGYDEKRIFICYGVIFRHRVTIPVCQIQDIHYFEGPIMMAFKLGRVMLSTAGSNFALDGLDKNTAQTMIAEVEEYLRRRVEENGNEKI